MYIHTSDQQNNICRRRFCQAILNETIVSWRDGRSVCMCVQLIIISFHKQDSIYQNKNDTSSSCHQDEKTSKLQRVYLWCSKLKKRKFLIEFRDYRNKESIQSIHSLSGSLKLGVDAAKQYHTHTTKMKLTSSISISK